MNTPLSWIKAYVPELTCTEQEYMDAMTLSGTKVEGYEKFDENLEKIIVGKINKIERHPDADKLVVCQVQIDEEGTEVQIVTGAQNVKEGDKVPVVLDGGRVATDHDGKKVAGGTKIKKGKLRGVESFGMMCSIFELGSNTDMYPDAAEDGIYILSDNQDYNKAPIGSDVPELLGLRDATFEYEITSNRVDCFGVLGIAREAAATFRKPFVPPVIQESGKKSSEKTSDYIDVDIQNNTLCSRYIARVVKNIKVAPSPEWMKRRLAACGIRPINNIVDITNYVMEEYAQPMHAYDLSTIEDNKIIVRSAKDGEKFTTLDGQERELDSSILMICDGKKPVGIAGIMGGENSMITDDATTLLLEAACFDGTNIRLSGKKLGMRTDAQAKFEKGLDPNTAMEAINRACQLIEELGAGEVLNGSVDVYPNKKEAWTVSYDPDEINTLLGTNIPEEDMIRYFETVDLKVNREKREVLVPTWRQDVLRMADLSEEVARFFGYDKIPTTFPAGDGTMFGKLSDAMTTENVLRGIAENFGYCEAMTYSFESPKVFDKLQLSEQDAARECIVISNPLGEDYSVMRTSLLNGMLTSLSTNYNHRNKEVALYELANIYLPKALPLTELPDERMQFMAGMYEKGDFFTMKGLLETIFEKMGIHELVAWNPQCERPYLHPGRKAEIEIDGRSIGYLGEVHPEVLSQYGIGTRAYIANLDVRVLAEHSDCEVKYQGVAKFPAITRDISLVMKKEVLAGSIEAVIRKNGGALLEDYHLFDIYEGDKIGVDEKSLAYSIRFRGKDRTLEDQDVQTVMDKILTKLSEIQVELRQ